MNFDKNTVYLFDNQGDVIISLLLNIFIWQTIEITLKKITAKNLTEEMGSNSNLRRKSTQDLGNKDQERTKQDRGRTPELNI